MNTSNLLYTALVLTDDSKRFLLNEVMKFAPKWENGRIIAEHHTIAFHTNMTDEILEWCVENEEKMFRVFAYEYGISDKAFAVKLETNIPCANETKHITIMVNTDNGGKPVDSNKITDWHRMPRIPLTGVVKLIYKNK